MIALCTGKYSALQKEKGQNTKKKKQETRNDQSLLKGNKTFKETTITAI